jgi:hypothetical protein
MHSLPVFKGVARPWHAGVLYNRDPRFAHILMALLKGEQGLVIGDNEPYSVTDASDYTIPVHGERRGVYHVAIEIRQDLIAKDIGQRAWDVLLARPLPQAYQQVREAVGNQLTASLLSPHTAHLGAHVHLIACAPIARTAVRLRQRPCAGVEMRQHRIRDKARALGINVPDDDQTLIDRVTL